MSMIKMSIIFCVFFLMAWTRASAQTIPGTKRVMLFGKNIISTPNREWTNTFSADGNTVYFTRGIGAYAIVYSKKIRGKWQGARVAPFSGTWLDTDPFLTPDGKRLYFASMRPDDQRLESPVSKNARIWFVEKTDNGRWSEPACLDTTINQPGVNTWYPSESEHGDFYFHAFNRSDGHGKNDIYYAHRSGNLFSSPKLLSLDTTGYNTQEPFISKDNKYLLFISDRPGSIGYFDIYIAFRKNDQWSEPVNLGKNINHAQQINMSPGLSYSLLTMYFATGYRGKPDYHRKLTGSLLGSQLTSILNGLSNIYAVPFDIMSYRRLAKFVTQ